MNNFKIRCSQIGKIMSNARTKGDLSVGCITYLKEWYAEQMYYDREDIYSKYLTKGNLQENESIEVIAEMLDLGIAFKNTTAYGNEWMTGTPDLLTENYVIDAKCSWNGKTFLEAITSEINSDYEWQLIGYMNLTERSEAKLCYALLNTPEESNYGIEVDYSNIDIKKRFFTFDVKQDQEKVEAIKEKVIKCREWLNEYDNKVKNLLK